MQNLRSPIISFGKYKDETLRDIYKEDPYYCLTFLRYVEDHPEYANFINQEFTNFINYWEEKYSFKRRRQPVTLLVETLNDYHIQRLYNCLGNPHIFKSKIVHGPTDYPDYVIENDLYRFHGTFYDCLIRKHIFNLQNRDAEDENIEYVLSEDDEFAHYKKYYKKFQDKRNDVRDILPAIYKLVLMENVQSDDEDVEFDSSLIDRKNIKKVLRYAESIPNVKNAILSPNLDTDYFTARADMIIGDTIIDFKVSKDELSSDDMDEVFAFFFQLIFYALYYYINEKKEIRKFMIYNPLLGLEYNLETRGLDFEMLLRFFEEVITI